ncbi:hypothetical protein [Dyella acidiphila]|uniref:Uncharacterized protein n=1 Tax=Dyella acidiphila TaxID=2775866 RepID=A0ABR9GFP4_9GAMM|nr:hypothetical protein [Dyella acidiphila]MBE1162870.1 hypothetical protein [Dyella acidiphila]
MTNQNHAARVSAIKFSFKSGEGVALGVAILEDALQAYRHFEQKHPNMVQTVRMPFDVQQLQQLHATLQTLGEFADTTGK